MISNEIIAAVLQLQKESLSSGNPPFSALLIADERIIASGYNQTRSSGNPLLHAEISVIQSAIQTHGSEILSKAHLVSSNEPCPMCMGACIWSGIREVSYFVSQEQVAEIRGWGKFMPAQKIAAADDSGIIIHGPIHHDGMIQMHREFWTKNGNSGFKHSIHLSDCRSTDPS